MKDENTCRTGDRRTCGERYRTGGSGERRMSVRLDALVGGEICDGPIAPDGNFQRCQSVGVLGFGGSMPCFTVNVNDLNGPAAHGWDPKGQLTVDP